MALARYESVAVNTAGDVIPNATVQVRRDEPGRPVVPLWADRNGTVALGNPITTDPEGKFGFHVTGGVYYIRVFTGPEQQPLQEYIRRYQAIGTAAERDIEDLAAALEAGTATFPTLAELEAFVPEAEGVGGKVTTGEDAGFYHYDFTGEAWVFDRPLFDTLARMNVIGGDANDIGAEIVSGIADSAVVMLWIEAPATNTAPVRINEKPVLTIDEEELLPGQWLAGRTYWFSDEGAFYKLRTESDVSGLVAQAEAAATAASGAAGAAAGSAGAAANSASEAQGYAAGLNLPLIESGDAGKALRVNAEEDGYELVPTNYDNVSSLASAGTDSVVYLTESGREGVFAWDDSDLSSEVAGDSVNTFYVPPASDPMGANGAYRRLVRAPAQPSWGGVLSDGSDSAADFQSFIDSLDPYTDIDLGGRDYTIGTGLIISTPGLSFRNGTIIADASIGDTDRLVSVVGTLGTAIALTANYNRSNFTITVTSTAGLAKGMICRISNTEKWGRPSSGSIVCSELFMIRAINSGTQIQLYGSLSQDYYTATTSVIEPLGSVDDTLFEGVRLIGKGAAAGNIAFETRYAKNVAFDDGAIWECAARGTQFLTSWKGRATHNTIEIDGGAAMYGGAASEGSRHIEFSHNVIPRCRHGFATSGAYVNRDIDACYNSILGATNAGMDTHASADNVNYSFNRIVIEGSDGTSDGIVVQGSNLRAEGNEITGAVRVGIYHQALVYDVSDERGNASYICNNRITADTLDTGVQVETDASPEVGSTTRTFSSVHIAGNHIEAVSAPVGTGVLLYANGASISGMNVVSGNTIRSFGASHGIWLRTTSSLTLQHYAITSNILFGASSNPSSGIQLTGGASNGVRYGTITGNVIRNATTGIAGTNARDAAVTGNSLAGISGTAISIGADNEIGANRVA